MGLAGVRRSFFGTLFHMQRVCPRDFGPLTAHEWGAATYLYCESCHGVLLEASELDKMLAYGTHPRLPLPAEEPHFEDGSALCSCSGRAMKSVSREGVTVDVCPSCGATWFDAGELRWVVAGKRMPFITSQRPESEDRGLLLALILWLLRRFLFV
jgi:Zn-finger nucleic acid-binding protein